jgi:hypothetical protein
VLSSNYNCGFFVALVVKEFVNFMAAYPPVVLACGSRNRTPALQDDMISVCITANNMAISYVLRQTL